MPKRYDNDDQNIVVDAIEDAIFADTYTKAIAALKFSRPRRSGFLAQQRNDAAYSVPDGRLEFTKDAQCRGTNLNAVFAHTQPRSALA